MFTDTHCHIAEAQFDADRAETIARAEAAKVSTLVEIAEEEPQWEKARALAASRPRIFWTVGFHPYYAAQADPGLAARLEAQCADPKCVAVGEIGLDYHRQDSPVDAQKKVLAELLATAAKAGKPVVLHCREAGPAVMDAQKDLLAILARHPKPADGGPAGVAHCFQGDAAVAWQLIERGFMVGVDAPITYPNAAPLRALFTHLPLESLVLETDSPYLPPQALRGKRNEPANIPAVARALAELRRVSVEEIARITSANAARLYRLPPPK